MVRVHTFSIIFPYQWIDLREKMQVLTWFLHGFYHLIWAFPVNFPEKIHPSFPHRNLPAAPGGSTTTRGPMELPTSCGRDWIFGETPCFTKKNQVVSPCFTMCHHVSPCFTKNKFGFLMAHSQSWMKWHRLIHLVGGFSPRLWTIWVRQLGWWNSRYMEKWQMFQTTNQSRFLEQSGRILEKTRNIGKCWVTQEKDGLGWDLELIYDSLADPHM